MRHHHIVIEFDEEWLTRFDPVYIKRDIEQALEPSGSNDCYQNLVVTVEE